MEAVPAFLPLSLQSVPQQNEIPMGKPVREDSTAGERNMGGVMKNCEHSSSQCH